MGVIPLWDEVVSINGSQWEIEADTTTSDLSMDDDGRMGIYAGLKTKNNQDSTHVVHLSLKCENDAFQRKFINAFIASQDFRDKCLYTQNTGSILTQEADKNGGIPTIPLFENSKKNESINRIIKLGTKAKFKDFLNLRSGRDTFSNQKEKELRENPNVDDTELDNILSKNQQKMEDADYVKTLRWMARGLPAKLALQKTYVDIDVAKKTKR
jgi:hypothetical protein